MQEKGYFSIRYQLKVLLAILSVIALSTVVIFISFNSFFGKPFGPSYSNAMHVIRHLRDFLLPIVVFSMGLFVIIASLLVAIVSVVMLHKIAGPTVRIERILDDLYRGIINPEVYFRKGDQIRPLAENLSALGSRLGRDLSSIRVAFEQIQKTSRELESDWENEKEKYEELAKICNRVKNVTGSYYR